MDKMKKMSKEITKIFHEHHKKTMQPKIKTTNPFSKHTKQGYMSDKIKVTNPFSGQSIMLTEDEHTLYNAIKMLEADELYEPMQKALDKFSRLNPKAYMVLLD